jgi:hypothetical protein
MSFAVFLAARGGETPAQGLGVFVDRETVRSFIMSKKFKGRIEGPFVPLLKETLATAAWRATSHGARSLYVALKSRYGDNFKNNGKIYLSSRRAATELGSNRDSVLRWFDELQYYGFIVMTNPGALGVDGKGKAPHWRLTELGYMNDPPTKDFLRWNRVTFGDSKKQNPGPKSGTTLAPKVRPPVAAKVGPPPAQSGRESGTIRDLTPGRESGTISKLTISSVKTKAGKRGSADAASEEAA